jgi:hypothetical protein
MQYDIMQYNTMHCNAMQIVHGTEGHMAVYGPVHILPYDPK